MLFLSAVISASVSFCVSVFQERINEQAHSESLVKQIRTTILNDLDLIIPVTENIEKSLSSNQVMLIGFKMYYYPTVILPMDNLGMLSDSTLNYIDVYQRRIDQCLRIREGYIDLLKSSTDVKLLKRGLFYYYVSLNSVIRNGINVIQDIDKHYPNLDKFNKQLPAYISLDDFKKKVNNIISEKIQATYL